MEGLRRQLAVERAHAGQALDRGPERLEGRAEPGRHVDARLEHGPGRHVRRRPRVADLRDERHDSPDLGLRVEVALEGTRPAGDDQQLGVGGAVRDGRPQRLGHERHDRVEQPQVRVEHLDQRPPRRLAGRRVQRLVREPDLGELEPPVAVLVPDRVVQDPGHLAEAVLRDRLVHRGRRRGGPGQQPALGRPEVPGVGQPSLGIGRDRCRSRPDHEARRVPELVGEVAGVVELGRAHPLVLPWRGAVDHARTGARRRRRNR